MDPIANRKNGGDEIDGIIVRTHQVRLSVSHTQRWTRAVLSIASTRPRAVRFESLSAGTCVRAAPPTSMGVWWDDEET